MLVHHACNQFIVGLKSIHPITRMIKEGNFKHVSLIVEQKLRSKHYHKIINFLHHNHIIYDQIYINRHSQQVTIDAQIDLIISCGKNYVHHMSRIGNVNKVSHYCIQTASGMISSYGADANWFSKKTLVTPTIIFNDCIKWNKWGTLDTAYFLHTIPLALTACITANNDTFITTNAMNGIVNLLKVMRTVLLDHERYNKYLFNKKLAYGDILVKTAYNNVKCPDFVTTLMQHCENVTQFELAMTLLSTKIFKQVVMANNETIQKGLELSECNINQLQQLFDDVYLAFTKQYENDEITKKILTPACLQAINEFELGGK